MRKLLMLNLAFGWWSTLLVAHAAASAASLFERPTRQGDA